MPIKISDQKFFLNNDDKTDELRRFAEIMRLKIIEGRYSALFLIDLHFHMHHMGVNPFKIIDEIEKLEGLGDRSRTKAASALTGPHLKGLWHKHYFGTGINALVRNIKLGLGTKGIEDLVAAELSGEEPTYEAIGKFAHEVVIGTYERRAAQEKLTGEWIIFAKHNGENYYLCLGGHEWGDEFMASRIRGICMQEFPFLSDLLGP